MSQAIFTHSHGISFHGSSIVAIAGDQINYTEEAGLHRLYQTVAHVGAFHDSEARYPPPKCHPDTRQAVLARLSEWITDQGTTHQSNTNISTPIYWLYGQAGMGKSAIAQTLAERFDGSQGNRYLAASFFFSRANPARSNPAFFVPTISLCLAIWTGNPSLRAAIDNVVKTNPTILEASVETQFRELVVNPLLHLSKEETLALPKVVIIDGLDECHGSDSQRRILTTILQGLVAPETANPRQSESRFPLRFLVASRPEFDIKQVFNRYSGITARTELGDNHQASDDIERYLRDEFARIYDERGLATVDIPLPWPSPGMIHNIVQRASGQFIYAKTVLKYVEDKFSTPVERLEVVVGLPVSDPNAFAELDALYHQILSTNPNTNRLVQVLGAILTVVKEDHNQNLFSFLDHLLSLPPGSVLSTLRGMHSVLNITEDGIRVSHKSFEDFLKDMNRSREYFIDFDVHRDRLIQKGREIINADQSEADNLDLDSPRRIQCLKFIFAFAKFFSVLPESYHFTSDVYRSGSHPVAGGGSSNMWIGTAHGQRVCLNVIRMYESSMRHRSSLLSGFCYEASIWRQLNHPNVLPFLGVNFDLFSPTFCAICPWMSNGNLLSFLRAHPGHDRILCITEIAEGMNYLHSLQPIIAHGDIKGTSVLVTDNIRCCLCGFDLALAVESQIIEPDLEVREAWRWLAPEFLANDTTEKLKGKDMVPRDVFAFGCTAYEILSGQLPHANISRDTVVRFNVMEGGRPPRPESRWCTDEIWALIERCWAQDPTSRPRSQEICDHLRQLG